jgi:hypothetical protein
MLTDRQVFQELLALAWTAAPTWNHFPADNPTDSLLAVANWSITTALSLYLRVSMDPTNNCKWVLGPRNEVAAMIDLIGNTSKSEALMLADEIEVFLALKGCRE